jgi:endoglucanase
MSAGQDYFMQVNEWNATAAQAMTYGGSFFFKMTTQMASVPTNGGPTGFPSMFIGANSGHTTTGSNLPKAVTELTAVPTTWTWNDNGTLADATNNSYNATYDVWFSTNPAGEPNASGPTGGYLMVWLHKPADAQPIGSVSAANRAVTIAGVPGTWDVWIGLNGTRPCISYVSTQTTLSLSYDLDLFIQDAVSNRPNTIQSTWYLTNIFSGFEIWRGGLNLESTSFCAVVN